MNTHAKVSLILVGILSAIFLWFPTAVIAGVGNLLQVELLRDLNYSDAVGVRIDGAFNSGLQMSEGWSFNLPNSLTSQPEIQRRLGERYFRQGRYRDAIQTWEQDYVSQHLSVIQKHVLSTLYATQGEWAKSIRIMEDEENNALRVARDHASRNDWQEALAMYKRFAVEEPHRLNAMYELHKHELLRVLAEFYTASSDIERHIWAVEYWLNSQENQRAEQLTRDILVKNDLLDSTSLGKAYRVQADASAVSGDIDLAKRYYELAISNSVNIVGSAVFLYQTDQETGGSSLLRILTEILSGLMTRVDSIEPNVTYEQSPRGFLGYDIRPSSEMNMALRLSSNFIVHLARTQGEGYVICSPSVSSLSFVNCDGALLLFTPNKVYVNFEGQNLVSNGGFDVSVEGSPVAWFGLYSGNVAQLCIELNEVDDNQVLSLANSNEQRFCGVSSSYVYVEPRGVYTLTFDAAGTDANLIVGGTWHHDDGSFLPWAYSISTSDKTRQNAIIVEVPDGTSRGTISISNYDSVGNVDIDNVSFIKIPSVILKDNQ